MNSTPPRRMGPRVSTMNRDRVPGPMRDWVIWPDEQVAELLLLLPGRQAAELERLAHSSGLTMGQLTRLLIRDYLADRGGPAPISKPAGGWRRRRAAGC
jgi:hypothetical protein